MNKTIELGDPRLAVMIDRLVAAFDPEEIYLFGSRARGDYSEESDYDLIIVVRHSDQPAHRRAQQAYRAIGSVGVGKDLLVWTREEFDRRRGVPASLPAPVLREGALVYTR